MPQASLKYDNYSNSLIWIKSARSEWQTRLIFRRSKRQIYRTIVRWPTVICSLAVFSLCTFVRLQTMIWPSIRFDISLKNFKKPLDIFSLPIERKRSKEYLVIILDVKESFDQFSCLKFIFEKTKHWEAGLKHKLKLKAWRVRIFRDTLILASWMRMVVYIYVSPNYISFTDR